MKKFQLNKKVIFIILTLFSIAIFLPWINMHYTLDNYTIGNLGYDVYSKQWSLIGGRLFMFEWLQLAKCLNIPLNVFVMLNSIIAILVSNISIILIYDFVLKNLKSSEKYNKFIIILVCSSIIYNFMFIDIMYFVENGVISLSILMYLISAKLLVNSKNIKDYIGSLIIAIIGVFLYQGTIGMLIMFLLLFSIIKGEKKYFTYIAALAGMFIALALNWIFVKLMGNLLELNQGRISSLSDIPINILFIVNSAGKILIQTCNLFPKFLYMILIIVTLGLICADKDWKLLKQVCLIFLMAFLSSSILFILSRSSFFTGRMRQPIGASLGMILLVLYLKGGQKNYLKNITLALLVLIIGITTFMYEFTMYEQLIVNKLEKKECEEIAQYVSNYEKINNIKVDTYIEIYEDKNEKAFYPQTRNVIDSIDASGLRHWGISYSTYKHYENVDYTYKKRLANDKDNYENSYYCRDNILYIFVYKS